MNINMHIKKFAALFAVLTCLLVFASAEQTGSTQTEVNFIPGQLNLLETTTMNFGSHIISGESKSYPMTNADFSVMINDLRGTGVGWKLTAIAENFQSGAAATLPGALIRLENPSAQNQAAVGSPPIAEDNILLDCDGTTSALIAQADLNQGFSDWRFTWLDTNVKLTIPGGVATAGDHAMTITWTLSDTP